MSAAEKLAVVQNRVDVSHNPPKNRALQPEVLEVVLQPHGAETSVPAETPMPAKANQSDVFM